MYQGALAAILVVLHLGLSTIASRSLTMKRRRMAAEKWPQATMANSGDVQEHRWCERLVQFHLNPPSELCDTAEYGVCVCDSISHSGHDIRKVGFDFADRPTFLSRTGVDWWLWFNHGRFFEAPWIFWDLSSPPDTTLEGSDSFFLEQCLKWRGYCAQNDYGASVRSTCHGIRPQVFSNRSSTAALPTQHEHERRDIIEGESRIIMTLDPNLTLWNEIVSSIGFFQGAQSPDIVITTRSAPRVENILTVLMKYRKLAGQFDFISDGIPVSGSVFTRPGFELGIEREGYRPVPFPSHTHNLPSLRPGVSCRRVKRNEPLAPEAFQKLSTEKKLLTRANKGYGCLIQDCQRHLPHHYKLENIMNLPTSCIGSPRTLAHKRIQLHWVKLGDQFNKTTSLSSYAYPVTYMNYQSGISNAICNRRFKDGTSQLGMLTESGRCTLSMITCTGKCSLGDSAPSAELTSVVGFEVLSISIELSNSRFKHSNAPKIVTYATVESMVTFYLRDDDKQLLEAVSGSSFSRLMSSIQRSTPSELAGFLSNKKFAVHPGNKIGIHLLRVLLAERVLDARRSVLGYDSDPLIQTFKRDGIVVIPMDPFRLTANEKLEVLRLFQYAIGSRSRIDERFTFFKVGVVHHEVDIQHQMHMDTFSSITKVFAFTENVDIHDGPFNYVNKSHRHGAEKLALIKKLVDLDEYIACESPRVYPMHQKQYGIQAVPLDVAGGSIVVADTNGYHFRGSGVPGNRRDYYTTSWEVRDTGSGGTGSRRPSSNIGGLPRVHPFCKYC